MSSYGGAGAPLDPQLERLVAAANRVLEPDHPERATLTLRSPVASRKLGIYVEVEIPSLGRSLVLDTRVDNPGEHPASLDGLPSGVPEAPWPKAPQPRPGNGIHPMGCPGSSCPRGTVNAAILGTREEAQIPVQIVAFHAEGHNGEVGYSIRMHSDVTGKLTVPIDEAETSDLRLWGRMVVTINPDDPASFGGLDTLSLVSQRYVQQRAQVHSWPPSVGDFLESVEPENYVALDGDPDTVMAVVRNGRVIFSDEKDEFLEARTRVHTFFYTDANGADLPPESSDGVGGVRLVWADVRTPENRATHYRLYRATPDLEGPVRLFDERIDGNEFVDQDFDGSRSFSYAVVPAMENVLGEEVLGIGLDYVTVVQLSPTDAGVADRFVGHVSFR